MTHASAPTILVSAGEVSGDIAGGYLVEALRHQCAGAGWVGLGGPQLRAAGVEILFETNVYGAVAFTEAARSIRGLFRAFRHVRRRLTEQRVDVAVLIGNDLFNVLLGRWLRWNGIPTVAYFPPQVWVWRAVLRQVTRSYDVVLASFEAEAAEYGSVGGRARVVTVGHYLAERLSPVSERSRDDARRALGLARKGRVVGLLPGSRRQEIDALTPTLFDAAVALRRHDPDLSFVLPVADERYISYLRRELTRRELSDVVVLTSANHDAMRASDMLLMASGTASLEAMLLRVPMIVVYRVTAPSYLLVRLLMTLDVLPRGSPIALPNLLLGRRVVPELQQADVRADRLTALAWDLLSNEGRRREMCDALAMRSEQLTRTDSVGRAARVILELAGERRPGTSRASGSEPA